MSVEHASAPAVAVEGLSKSFKIPAHQIHTLKERALHPFRRQEMRSVDVLRDISFSVAEGEFFGIVGRNGSGKSTLLKCLAGIYGANAGTIRVKGRLSAFIELGVGFNMDLAARDNVMINATLLGLSPRDARRRCDEVIAFAELERHTELKLKNYSSGMLVRLAFAVMIQVDADVLLIDEVLAVGDAAFQQKCYDEFRRLRDEGRTVVLVTHDMSAVERFCDQAMLIEDGRITNMGEPHEVGLEYLAVNFAPRDQAKAAEPPAGDGRPAGAGTDAADDARYGSREAEIVDAWFEDESGSRTDVLPTGQDCAFVLEARFATDVDDPLFGFVLQNAERVTVFGASTTFTDARPGTYRANETVIVRIRFRNMLAPDRYDATPAVAFGGTGISWIDRRERFASVVVTGPRSTDAVLEIPYDISVNRYHGDSSERAMLA